MKKTIWRSNYNLLNDCNIGYLSKMLRHYNLNDYNFTENGIFINKELKRYFIEVNIEQEKLLLKKFNDKNNTFINLNVEFTGLDAINKVCRWINNRCINGVSIL